MRLRAVTPFLVALLLASCAVANGSPSPDVPSSAPATASASAPGHLDILSYRGGAGRAGTMPGPGPTAVASVRWQFQAFGPIGSQPVVVDTVVYVVSTEGTLHAIDLDTGDELWHVGIGDDAQASPEIADGLVILGAEDGAHAFATVDGREAWSIRTIGPVRGAPAIVGHIAIFASDGATATAVDTRTGEVLWTHPLRAADNTSVAAADGLVVFGLQDGVAVALALANGTERWRADTGDGARIGTPAIADGRVYLATLDDNGPGTHHIVVLDLDTGSELWRFDSPGDVPAYTPAIADGRAIVDSEDGSVTALDVANGGILWQAPAPGLVEVVPTIADGTVYAASNGGSAFALDAATGLERWRVPIKGVPYGLVVASGLAIVGTNLGGLYAIGGAVP